MNREKFDVEFLYEIADNFFMPLRVIGTITPWLPEMKPSLDQPGAPAEGRELEDLQVYSGARLPPLIEADLLSQDAFMRAVEAAL